MQRRGGATSTKPSQLLLRFEVDDHAPASQDDPYGTPESIPCTLPGALRVPKSNPSPLGTLPTQLGTRFLDQIFGS